jgi:hypothetical protein
MSEKNYFKPTTKEVKKAIKPSERKKNTMPATIGTAKPLKPLNLPAVKLSKANIQEALDYFKEHPEEAPKTRQLMQSVVRAKAYAFARRDQSMEVSPSE